MKAQESSGCSTGAKATCTSKWRSCGSWRPGFNNRDRGVREVLAGVGTDRSVVIRAPCFDLQVDDDVFFLCAF